MKINFKEFKKKVNSKYKSYKKKFIFYIKDKDYLNKLGNKFEKDFKPKYLNYLNKLGNKFEKDFKPKYQNFVHITIPNLQEKTNKLASILVRDEGSEFWSALTPTQKWSRKIIWSFVGVTSFGIIWCLFTLIDDTVQVQGKLEPFGTTIEVKVPLGGVIKKIAVSEGEIVEDKQILLELDTTAVKSKLKALKIVKSQIEADILLSKIQLGEQVDILNLTPNQKTKLEALNIEYESRIDAARNSVDQANYRLESNLEQINTLNQVLSIREEVLKNLKDLIVIGGLSEVKYLKEQQEVIQLRGRLESLNNDLKTSQALLKESENKLSNTIAATNIDFSTKIEENEKQLAQIQNQINESKLTLNYQKINSPVRGVVFDLQPAAPGYVVDTQFPILKIVPIDELVARVFVSNRDIAFLKIGQLVKVRVDAYPYNEFGEIDGLIDSIGSDVLEPDQNFNFYRFPVTIKVDKPYIIHKNKELPLRTGMSLSANIVLRQRPVLSLFTERILPFWSGLEQL